MVQFQGLEEEEKHAEPTKYGEFDVSNQLSEFNVVCVDNGCFAILFAALQIGHLNISASHQKVADMTVAWLMFIGSFLYDDKSEYVEYTITLLLMKSRPSLFISNMLTSKSSAYFS